MSDFGTVRAEIRPLDPHQRVRYAHGLVLGHDDFVQEQSYLMERDDEHQRVLHGYGTACGLALSRVEDPTRGPELRVSPGVAIDPVGHTIRVPEAQCASLDPWLQRNRRQITDPSTGAPFALIRLEVRLCYAECLTGIVPIPGGPCRTQQDAMTESRIADSFRLGLVLVDPVNVAAPSPGSPAAGSPPAGPSMTEDEAAEAFGDLLRSIRVGTTSSYTSVDVLIAAVRAIGVSLVSPPAGSPPGIFDLDPATAVDDVRAMMRIWITEVRPRFAGGGRGCAAPPSSDQDDGCVSLGFVELAPTVALDGSYRVALADIRIDDADRPLLLSTRVLQEWTAANALTSGAAVSGPATPISHASLLDLTIGDDHTQYYALDGARPLANHMDAGGFQIRNLLDGNTTGHAVTYDQAVKSGDPLPAPSDLGGNYPGPRVTGLQGTGVRNVAPTTDGQVLTYQGGQWEPGARPVGSTGSQPLTAVAGGYFRLRQLGRTIVAEPVGPVYNDLTLTLITGSTSGFLAAFTGYRTPSRAWTYVVTSIAVVPGGTRFIRFVAGGVEVDISGLEAHLLIHRIGVAP